MPEFKTEGQKKIYDKLAEMLRDQFGKQAMPNEKEPSFGLRSGSAYAQVGVWPISDKHTVVRLTEPYLAPAPGRAYFLSRNSDGDKTK